MKHGLEILGGTWAGLHVLVTGIFAILKLCNVISWHWGWVLIPLSPVVLAGFIILCVVLYDLLIDFLTEPGDIDIY